MSFDPPGNGPAHPPLPPLPPAPPRSGNWFARHKVASAALAFVGVLVIVGVTSALVDDSGQETATQESAASATATPIAETESPEPATEEPTPEELADEDQRAVEEEDLPPDEEPELNVDDDQAELTTAQENALEKAEGYLEFTAFSRSGLIDQLLHDGFARSDATFAVDALDADWMEQAAKKAEQYLEYSAFSLSGLIEQLEYDGFTSEEARYGAEKAYS